MTPDLASLVAKLLSGCPGNDCPAEREEAAAALESLAKDGPTGDFGMTDAEGNPVPCTMRLALIGAEAAASAEAKYADEQRQRAESLALSLAGCQQQLKDAVSEAERAEAESAALRKDAERWRFVATLAINCGHLSGDSYAPCAGEIFELQLPHPKNWECHDFTAVVDAAIDAATHPAAPR